MPGQEDRSGLSGETVKERHTAGRGIFTEAWLADLRRPGWYGDVEINEHPQVYRAVLTDKKKGFWHVSKVL